MTLADTPTTWVDGPSISTLETLAIFVGIPLLVIVTVFLLVYAPSWVKGPRYRPGQPWDARSEIFGTPVADEAAAGVIESGAGPVDAEPGTADQGAGGASAGW